MFHALSRLFAIASPVPTPLFCRTNRRITAAAARLLACFLFLTLSASVVLGQAPPPPAGGGSPLPVAFVGDPGYPTHSGAPFILLPGDPGYPNNYGDPVIIWLPTPGGPIYIWPWDPDYPYLPGDPIILWPGDPNYPLPPFQWGDPILVNPGDPGYPSFPIFPNDPIIIPPGTPGYPANPYDPGFPPVIVSPGAPGYPVNPGDPITVNPGDPSYPGNPGTGPIGPPGTPGYPGDPAAPGNPVTIPPAIPYPDGHNPFAGVVLGSDGLLYGTTERGGALGYGVVFRMDTTGHNYTILHTFTGADGDDPISDLVFSNGWLYGTTRVGGEYNAGVLFELDTTGQRSGLNVGAGEAHWLYVVMHQFWYFTGAYPYNGVTLGQDGCLYGTTYNGGASDTAHAGDGVVFKYDPTAHTYSVLHTFQTLGPLSAQNMPDGICPHGLVQAPDGFLYGTTQKSGTSASHKNGGTVFKIQTNGSQFQTIHVFQSDGSLSDGSDSEARLLVGSDGYLYGTTRTGALASGDPNSAGFGTVFKLSTSGSGYLQLHAFGRLGSQADGLYPCAGLIQGADGNLYGTTLGGSGSPVPLGTVYRIGITGSGFQIVHSFVAGDTCGEEPYSAVIQDSSSNLYGTTYTGASQGYGAVYQLSPGGTGYALHKFGNPVDNPDDPGGGTGSTVQLLTLTLNPTSLTGGSNSVGTVVLNGPAPLQGAVISLSTDNTALVSVFRTVVVSAGQTTATFGVSTRAVSTPTTVNITAAYNGSSLSAPLTINPPTLTGLTLNPNRVTSGANSVGIVTLSGPAPVGGMLVNLSNSLPDAVTLPSVVLVRAGLSGVSFLAASNQVNTLETSTITATLNDVSKQATLAVWPGSVLPAGILADASVQGGINSFTNYGLQPVLFTETDAVTTSNSNAVTYLKFDLTHVVAAPTAATLKLTVNPLSSPANGIARVRVYGVQDTTWTETGITWANAPSLNTSNITSAGTLLTTVDVPLSGGVAAFDVTSYVVSQLGKLVTFQVIADSPDGQTLAVNSKEAASGHPQLLLASSFLNDVPAPLWALGIIPTDSSPSGGGPSSSDSVDLASGVEENTPGPDIAGRNPVGPSAVFARMYRSVQAATGYCSPGLSPGWTHNYDIRVQGVTGTWDGLTLSYPNGAQEKWDVALDGNVFPTGYLYPLTKGAPYLVQGIPSPNTVGQWLTLTVTWKDHSSWTFTPDPNAPDSYLLTCLTNAVGRSIYVVYDGTHRLQAVTDDSTPANTLLSFQYTNGYLASVTDPYARTVNFTFGQTNGGYCLTGASQLNSAALEWQYDYTAVNGWPMLSSVGVPDPTAVAGPSGVPIRTHPITYYPDGRVATLVDANGNTRLYTYAAGTQVQVYSPTGALADNWTQSFGALNNGTGYTDANNASNQVFYDDPANPYLPTQYTSKDPAHLQMIAATYDAFGNTVATQASCNGGFVTTSYQYDYTTFALGMLTSVQQVGMNSSTQYSYYPNGLVQSVSIPWPGNIPPPGLTTPPTITYYYTALGNISMVTKPAPNASGQLVSYRYNYVYDPLGPTQQTEALGQPLTVTGPDGAVTHYRYDARGNRVAIIDAMGNRIDMVFNIADQLTSTILPATGQTGTGRAHTDITYQYLGGPAVSTTAYDESNNPVRQAAQTSGKEGEALAQTGNTEQVSATYDAVQRLSTLKDGNGNAFVHAYDAVGNLNQLTYPDGNSLRGQFGPDGNLTQFTNARGQNSIATLIPNDPLLQSVLHSDGHSDHFVYDQFGRTTEVSDGNTTLDYTYDDLNNVLSATSTYPNARAFTVSYSYNPDGSRASMQYSMPGTGSFVYFYDLCGRLTDVINVSIPGVRYHYDYDLLGHLIHKKTYATETYYAYNAASQLVGLTNYDGLQNLASDYSNLKYDGAGNLLSMTVKVPPVNPLPGEGPTFTAVGTLNYTYDSLDHLTGEQSVRNITVANNTIPDVLAYNNPVASDAADNLTQLRGVTFSGNSNNQVTGDSNGAAYGYDADGDATTQEGVHLQYDDAGHVIAYDDNTNNIHFTFGYRPDGLRAWKASQGGAPTFFYYDGARLIGEMNTAGTWAMDAPGSWQQWYGWGAAGLEQIAFPNSTLMPALWYAFDPQGNLVNRFSGSVIDLVCYDAFGDGIADLRYPGWAGASLPSDPVGWGGQWGAYTDVVGLSGQTPLGGTQQAGLILLTNRYYNPDTGRFLTRDPAGQEGGVNVYSYTRNNPVSFADPSGLSGWDWKTYGIGAAKIGLEIGMGIAGGALFPANPLLGGAVGTAVVDGLWAYLVDHETPGKAAVTALRSGVLAFIGGKAAEKAIGAILEIPAVRDFIAEYGGKAAEFVKDLLCKLKGECFIAGTPVQVPGAEEYGALFANKDTPTLGSTIPLLGMPVTTTPVEQIQSGNTVVTRNPVTGQTEFKRVVATTVHTVKTLLVVALSDKATGKVVDTITATPEHPFNVAGKGFTAAINLAIGNAIVTRAGPALIVQSITPQAHPEGVLVYNFEVEDDHTYFVGNANGGIWVHNDCAPKAGQVASGGSPALEGDPYHPASVEARIRPRYAINPAHLPGANPNKTKIPDDAALAYETATRIGMKTWLAKGERGWYRYFHDNVDSVHFSGLVRDEDVPVWLARSQK